MQPFIGPLLIDLMGLHVSEEELELLQHPLVSGVVLFSRNFESCEQLSELVHQIRGARKKPLLITVDHEGGRVQRFRKGFTVLPAMGVLGRQYDHSKEKALSLAKVCGFLMASELGAFQIDLSFAPVLDLDKSCNTVIADRAFHRDPDVVAMLAKTFIEGMHEAGMSATGKHFPGHGSVTLDSHLALPRDERSLDEVMSEDARPFKMLLPFLNAIMPAHILFPRVDEYPVGFSAQWLQTILRDQLGFKGVVVSDDLNMEGAKVMGSPSERAEKALKAGCNIILLCNNRADVIHVLDHLPEHYGLTEEQFKSLQGKRMSQCSEFKGTHQWKKYHELVLSLQENL